MTQENHCKLADFGLVFDLTNSPRSRAIEGDSRYIAPELMQGQCGLANDIFSLGITLLELACSLDLPANGKLWQELRSSVLPEQAMELLSPELVSIIRSMMEPDPAKRPTVNDLLKNQKLKVLNCQRRCAKISTVCAATIVNSLQLIKSFLLLTMFLILDFFKLEKQATVSSSIPIRSKVRIMVRDYDEHSDDETSFRTSLNTSHVSKVSANDDDNNNESSITPTFNNSIPRITPELIVNSTPLNHFNGQDGLSSRKYRRDLTKLR